MKNLRKVSVYLLVLSLLISIFSSTLVMAAEEPAGDYKLVENFTVGNRYIIATEYNGEYYAFAFADGALYAEKVNVDGDLATPASDNIKWTATPDDTIENVGTPGTFIYAGSYGLMTYTTGRTFVYDAENKQILMHNLYYLTYDGVNFSQSKDEAEACKVLLFEKVMPSTTEVVEPAGDFTKSDAFVLGNRYVIATEYNGEYYGFALTDGALTAEKVAVNGDSAVPATDNAKWTVTADDTIESVGAPGTFIYAGSYGLMTYTTGRTFTYNAEGKYILMHNLYYLTFDGTNFGQSKEAVDACEVVIFGKEMPKIAVEEKYIPDGSDLPVITRKAVKNADGSITLAFVSDVHHSLGYDQNNLQVWLENMKGEIGYIDAMGFCGDMGSAYSATAAEYWANTQGVIDYMDTKVASGYVGDAIYTFGNHEWYPTAGGDFMNNYENNPTADRLLRIGEGLKTDEYIIYCFGAGSISAKMSQGYSEEDIARLDAYLATAPTDLPIFILTHFPVHFWGDRLSANADKLAAVLNKHPNVVVIWGHNHSDFDEYYDEVCKPGDTIIIDSKGTEVKINFTYLSAGCISDAEYTGASGGSAWVLGKGLIVNIAPNGTLSFDYYTQDAKVLGENGPYFVEYRDGIRYETLKTEYVEKGGAGTPPDVSDVINFKFIGWDVDVSDINRHTVATSVYEYTTNLDPNYVYFTVQEGEGIAIGKSGKAILQYAIPYTDNMTAMDALKALQDAEFAGGSAEISVGTYGALNTVWGHSATNGAWIMEPTSGTGYIYTTEKLIGGRTYFINALDGDAFTETSYLSPYYNNIFVGETLAMKAESWVFNPNTYGYAAAALNGDVYIGTTLENLADSGIDAIDGAFDITFDKAGTYYVAVKSANAGLAVNTVTVADVDAAYAPQNITIGGKNVTADAYNIAGDSYIKLRDIANALNSIGIDYDADTKTVIITTNAAYIGNGDEQGGVDNSATAVVSKHAVKIDGVAADILGFNIGGNNYYKLADLQSLIGF